MVHYERARKFTWHIRAVPLGDLGRLTVISASDASPGCMPRQGSQGEMMVLLSDVDVEKGDAVVCPLIFASHRIKRVCASSLSVEALSVNTAVQQGDFVRALLAEILCADFEIRRCSSQTY